MPLKRKSQQGSIGGNDKSGGRRNVIKVSISVKEDVKLHETENAWRPAHLNAAGSLTEDEKKTEVSKTFLFISYVNCKRCFSLGTL